MLLCIGKLVIFIDLNSRGIFFFKKKKKKLFKVINWILFLFFW
jgi:hypothetical protein